MDLFNLKKVAALQGENLLVTAKYEATAKELADLKTNVQKSYDSLTEYFKPKYVNKYFAIKTDAETIRVKMLDVKYVAGMLEFSAQMVNGSVIAIPMTPGALKYITVIPKKEFTGEEVSK